MYDYIIHIRKRLKTKYYIALRLFCRMNVRLWLPISHCQHVPNLTFRREAGCVYINIRDRVGCNITKSIRIDNRCVAVKPYFGQVPALKKRLDADACHAARNSYACQVIAIIKRRITYACNAVRYGHTCQFVAIIKCPNTDAYNAVPDNNTRQATTITKCIEADVCHAVRNCYSCQFGA
jgi:hypothetical protein